MSTLTLMLLAAMLGLCVVLFHMSRKRSRIHDVIEQLVLLIIGTGTGVLFALLLDGELTERKGRDEYETFLKGAIEELNQYESKILADIATVEKFSQPSPTDLLPPAVLEAISTNPNTFRYASLSFASSVQVLKTDLRGGVDLYNEAREKDEGVSMGLILNEYLSRIRQVLETERGFVVGEFDEHEVHSRNVAAISTMHSKSQAILDSLNLKSNPNHKQN